MYYFNAMFQMTAYLRFVDTSLGLLDELKQRTRTHIQNVNLVFTRQ